jgi:hypothetical protein
VKIFRNSFTILKLGIALGAYGFVVYKLGKQDCNGVLNVFSTVRTVDVWMPIIAILLMPAAWLFEAIKWKFSLRNIEPTSLSNAFKSVWYGVSVGLLTPNRVGEPIGRMYMVKSENRGKAGVMAVLCGMSQQFATIFFGAIGLILMYGSVNVLPDQFSNPIVNILLGIITIITVVLVFKIDSISRLLAKNRFVKRMLGGESVDLKIPHSDPVKLIILSIVRYFVFSTQFVLILLFFGYDNSVVQVYYAIFATYLFASAVPSFALGEAGVRTSFALVFIGGIWGNIAAVTVATLLLWILNVALPGLIAAWLPLIRAEE